MSDSQVVKETRHDFGSKGAAVVRSLEIEEPVDEQQRLKNRGQIENTIRDIMREAGKW